MQSRSCLFNLWTNKQCSFLDMNYMVLFDYVFSSIKLKTLAKKTNIDFFISLLVSVGLEFIKSCANNQNFKFFNFLNLKY